MAIYAATPSSMTPGLTSPRSDISSTSLPTSAFSANTAGGSGNGGTTTTSYTTSAGRNGRHSISSSSHASYSSSSSSSLSPRSSLPLHHPLNTSSSAPALNNPNMSVNSRSSPAASASSASTTTACNQSDPSTTTATAAAAAAAAAAANAAHRPRLTEQEKKNNHIASEQKRRAAIREGFDRLTELVPGLEGQGRSEGVVLKQTVEFMQAKLRERAELVAEIERRGGSVEEALRRCL